MKLISVTIDNFMAIGSATVNLADRGLVLIQGENPDESSATSNGAGKSSIADAISWCLYGMTARGEDGDKVVNRTAGKDCRVRVIVEDGTSTYDIVRYRKHKTEKNSVRILQLVAGFPGPTELTKGTTPLTQKAIDQIIGCSWDVFCGAVYAGQERMPDLPGKTDKELKMLIEEASGATLLEAAYQESNRLLRETQIASNNADTMVLRAIDAVDGAKRNLTSAVERKDRFEVTRLDDVKRWHTEGLAEQATIKDLEASLAKMGDKAIIEGRITALDHKIASVDGELAEDRENTAAFETASRAYAVAGTNLATAKRSHQAALDRLASIDHQIGCPCGECARPYTVADLEPARLLAFENAKKLERAATDAKATVDAALLRMQSAADARDAYRASMTDLTATNAARASLQAQLRDITLQESAITGHRSDLALLVRQMKAKKVELNPYIDDIAKIGVLIDDREGQLANARDAQAKATDAVRIHEAVAKVFSPSGVRAFLLDEVTPFLNDQTAKYLGTLSDGHISATWTTLVKTAKGELREKFSIEVNNATGGETFKSISGGEKRKVRIACALALQDLVARRATKPIELFIGDEIDDALDDAGRERLMTILEEKAKERGSVFIISHSDLKDWIRNQITVKKVGGKSSIEEVMA